MKGFRLGKILTTSALLTSSLLLSTNPTNAELRLPSLFSDGMVLQRDQANPLWGWADPGQAVIVNIAGRSEMLAAAADENGRWMVELPALPANDRGLSILVTTRSGDPILINDVLVGEVWLCSGQSNMVWSLINTAGGAEEAAQANDPMLRFYQVATHASADPMDDRNAQWLPTTPDNARTFTGVGYYFGKELREKLDVPVGIIRAAYGGTIAEPWISIDTYETAPELEAYRARIAQMEAEHPGLMETFDAEYKRRMELLTEFNAERNRLRAEGVPESDWPTSPGVPSLEPGGRYLPAVLYNAMIAPLVPYGMRGFAWYQGESNTGYFNDQHAATLNTLIEDWRRQWSDPQMPFLIVQLANFRPLQEGPLATSTWANVREAQRIVARDNPGVGMIVTIDVGEADDIHPGDKRTVGERLARLARVEVYGEQGLLPGGPELAQTVGTSEGVVLRFLNIADGLRLRDGEDVQGITIHSEGTEPAFALAQIGAPNAIFVLTSGIEGTVTVRHAWAENPIWNVVNSEGLPLGPFEVVVER